MTWQRLKTSVLNLFNAAGFIRIVLIVIFLSVFIIFDAYISALRSEDLEKYIDIFKILLI